MRNQSSGKNHFESHICIFPEPSGKLLSIVTQDIVELSNKTTKRKLLGENKNTYTYKYTNLKNIVVSNENIIIGDNEATIDYEDVVHVESFSEKALDVHITSVNAKFMLLVVAKYKCPYCDTFFDYISALPKHIYWCSDKDLYITGIPEKKEKKLNINKYADKKLNSEIDRVANIEAVEEENITEIDITEIMKGDKQLFYIYLMGKGNVFGKSGINNHVRIKNEPTVSGDDFEKLVKRISQRCDNLENNMIILNNWLEKPGELRIEGLEKGNSISRGTISGKTESEGVSRGIQVGPFTRGESKSRGSIEGKIETATTDNTFSSDIEFLQIDKNGIYVESDPIIDVRYSDIDRVAKRDNGLFAEIGQQTYSIIGYGSFGTASLEEYNLDEVISSIKENIENSDEENKVPNRKGQNDSNQTPAEKIQDLNTLYDEGIISEDEFNSKKKQLLDEF